MAKTDFVSQSDDQLAENLGQLKREQFNLRFQAATNQLEKSSRVREVRRDIAEVDLDRPDRKHAARRRNDQEAEPRRANRCDGRRSRSTPRRFFIERVIRTNTFGRP